MIASATVDADRRTLVISGWHFGERSAVVALGHRVVKVKNHSDSELVVELPTDVSPGRVPLYQGQVVSVERLGIPYVLESNLAVHISLKHTQYLLEGVREKN
jgi:hypothetical protein